MCYRLGLITKWEHDKIDLMRRIRNTFAHDYNIRSFSDEIIKNQVNNLKIGIEMIPFGIITNEETAEVEILPPDTNDTDSPRELFHTFFITMLLILSARKVMAAAQKRTEPDNFGYSFQCIDIMINKMEEIIRNMTEQKSKIENIMNAMVGDKHELEEAEKEMKIFYKEFDLESEELKYVKEKIENMLQNSAKTNKYVEEYTKQISEIMEKYDVLFKSSSYTLAQLTQWKRATCDYFMQ